MRLFLAPLFALALAPLMAQAGEFAVPSRVDAVTLYPWGAQVSRQVAFTAPAGLHRVIVPDLPAGTYAGALRIVAPDGVKVGSVSLANDRQPTTEDLTRADIKAAMAEVERLEVVLRDKENAITVMRLEAEAADAQALFLRQIGKDGEAKGSAEEIRDLAQTIGSGILAARKTALAAAQAADAAERGLKPDQDALDKARQALAALTADPETATLVLSVETEAEGPVTLTVLDYSGEGSWQPVYDLRLDRSGDTDTLVADRGVLISQNSGEDWLGVKLTLSTARPAEQNAPSKLYPWRQGIIGENERYKSYDSARAGAPAAAEEAPAPVVIADAAVEMAGATVTYVYPAPVDLRTGVEDLRLSLDSLTLTPKVRAEAVPSRDQTAFVVAGTRNSTPEILLPGEATLWLDGQMVGQTQLPLVAANDETDIGFGPIDGLILTRKVPTRSEGDTGVLSRSTQVDEKAILTIENLTGEDWPIRVIDQVPYSEQDDLVIKYAASPKPTIENLDDERGLLVWDFDIAKGTKQVIELSYRMTWPSGFVLE
jgi:uncharacterized protein (TIGR02231 family)